MKTITVTRAPGTDTITFVDQVQDTIEAAGFIPGSWRATGPDTIEMDAHDPEEETR